MVDALSDRRDGDAAGRLGRQQRPCAKPAARHPLPRQLDERRREVDPQDLEPAGGQRFRQDAATAAEVDHQATVKALAGQLLQQERGGAPGEVPEARVVDVRQALAVGSFHRRPSAHGPLHERADPCLLCGGQLLQREGDRPHGAFVEVRILVEAERHVPLLELVGVAEKSM